MAVRDITSESDFESVISAVAPGALVTLYFHTPWAAPCKSMRTFYETLASQYPASDRAAFLAVDAEELPDISESYDVTAVPFIVLTRNGKILDSISGSNTARVRDAVEKEAGGSGAGAKSLPEKLAANAHAVPLAEGAVASGSTNGASKDLSEYAPGANDPKTGPEYSSKTKDDDTQDQTDKEDINTRLAGLVKAAPVMLFMKGTPSAPECGFSRQLVAILREKGVRYGFFNILADDDVRQGLKVFSDWPTFPQLYLQGELVGGLDIVKEELENDPGFFAEVSVGPGKGGMAGPDQQKAALAAA